MSGTMLFNVGLFLFSIGGSLAQRPNNPAMRGSRGEMAHDHDGPFRPNNGLKPENSGSVLNDLLSEFRGGDEEFGDGEEFEGRGGRGHRHHFPPFPFDHKNYTTNITCPVVDDEPTCLPFPPRFPSAETGTWVCRTLYNPITGIPQNKTTCIDDDVALITDKCGCCEPEGCPKPCECTCMDGRGVLVDFTGEHRRNGTGFSKCMPPEVAVSVVAMVEDAICHTTCDN